MTTDENKAIVRRFVDEIFVQGTRTRSTSSWPTTSSPTRGRRPATRRTTSRPRSIGRPAALADPVFTIDDLIAEGDRVAVRLTAAATQVGEIMGMPAEWQALRDREIHMFRLRDGKVVEHWHQFDQMGMMKQLGAMPGSPRPGRRRRTRRAGGRRPLTQPSGRGSSGTSQCASSSSNRRCFLALERRLVRVQPGGDLGVAVRLHRRPVAVRDRDEDVPVGPAVAVEPRRAISTAVNRPLASCSRRIGQWFLPEQLDELVVGAPARPVEVEDLDRRRSSWSRPPRAAAWSSSHARSTWRASVRRLPTASRIVNRPRSFVCDRNTSPVRLTASMIAALWASSGRVVARERRRDVAEADGRERHRREALPVRASASTQAANAAASSRWWRIRRRSPSSPNQRSWIHSFSARNRRPELGRVLVVVALGASPPPTRPEVLRDEAEGVAQDVQPAAEQERRVERGPQPLVGVDDDRVGPLPAGERLAQPGIDRDGAGVRGVDVEPQALALRRCRRWRRPDRPRSTTSSRPSRRSRSGGGRPRDRAAIAASSASGRSSKRSFVGIRTSDARPRPRVMHAFSIEEWASSDA